MPGTRGAAAENRALSLNLPNYLSSPLGTPPLRIPLPQTPPPLSLDGPLSPLTSISDLSLLSPVDIPPGSPSFLGSPFQLVPSMSGLGNATAGATQGPTPDSSGAQATPGNTSALSTGSIVLTPDQLTAIITNAVQSTATQIAQTFQSSRTESSKAKALRASSSSLPKLKDGAYQRWSFALTDTIRTAGLLGHLDGTSKRPTNDTSAEDRWDQEDAAVRATIVGALDHDMVYRYLEGTKTAKEAWDALERHWKTNDTASLMAVDKELANLHMSEGADVVEHIATLRRLKRRLDGSDFEVNEVRCKAILFRSLPPSYEPWISRHEESDSTSFDKLCTHLETQYRSQKARSNSDTVVSAFPAFTRLPRSDSQANASAFNALVPPDLASIQFTNTRNPTLAARSQHTCRDCLQFGHRSGATQCPAYVFYRWRIELWGPLSQSKGRNDTRGRRNGGGSDTANANPATVTPTTANVATTNAATTTSSGAPGSIETVQAQCATMVIPTSSFPSYAAYSAIVDNTVSEEALAFAAASIGSFLIDTGCQRHMTCMRSIFTDIEEIWPPVLIRGIGDKEIEASQRGTVAIPVEINGILSWFYLSDVLYAPDLHRNLISTGALLEAGMHVNLAISGATIYSDATCSMTLATAAFKERLWILETESSIAAVQANPAANANVAVTGVSWHKRFGHIGSAALRHMANAGQIDALTKRDLETVDYCKVCVLAKGARLPFYRSVSSSSSAPLELIHSDLCGPHDASVGGAKYSACFVDDFTRLAWVFLLRTKDELATVFKRLRAHVELFTGLKIKTLRSDGGGEYQSHLLADHLADAGILHQTSCANSSQQNGVAERFQRTLFDRIRSLLKEADMSWGWWGEAALTATYLYNRTPHSALPESLSPLSYWSNKPVSIAHIRVFGSTCFAIDTSKDRKKSAPRAVECRLLGYDAPSKAYRLQVKGSTKVVRSRDVIFHENLAIDTSSDSGVDEAVPVPMDLDCPPPGKETKVLGSVGGRLDSVGGQSDSVGETTDGVSMADTSPIPDAPSTSRPKRDRKPTWKLRESAESNAALTAPRESYNRAMKGPEREEWQVAIDSEYGSWDEKGVCDVVERPDGAEIIPTILLLSRKTDETGAEVRKKARCVARGDLQSQSLDEGPRLAAPVASMVTLRAMAGVAAHTNCELQQMDVKTAFLHAPLSRPVFLSIPAGFPASRLLPNVPRANQALKLKRAVYGLAEAPASWYSHCTGILKREGFTRSDNDHCLFWITPPGSSERCYVLIYVDDFTLMTKSTDLMTWLKARLSSLFDLKDLGAATQVLGLEFTRDREAGTMSITQCKFTRQLLEEYNMLDCRPLDTPMFANATSALPSHELPLTEQERVYMRDKDYRHLLGCLNWLALGSRPEISYALAKLGQAQSNPHPEHWHALIHVLRYLSKTVGMGLVYSRTENGPTPCMYTDSAYADCPITRKSHSGYVVLLSGAAISWSSRKQPRISTSSTEAEYFAMGDAAKQAVWVERLLSDLGISSGGPFCIYADNQSSILIAESEKLSSRTKHVDVQYHYVRELVQQGRCRFKWVPTDQNAADVFTKPLGPARFQTMPPMLGVPWICRDYTKQPIVFGSGTHSESLCAPSGSVEPGCT